MPAGISAAKGRRSSKTKARGGRAKLGLPAKAGKRKLPAPRSGKHITTAEQRNRDMWLVGLGVQPYVRPAPWRMATETV